MGLHHNGVKLLFKANINGTSFKNTLTIGRLNVRSHKYLLQDVLISNKINKAINIDWVQKLTTEDILQLLGSQHTDSLDYSDYQGCSIIHDLNQPLPKIYHRQYDAVIEGGTIEHVFNSPLALKSCMDAVKQGGRLFIMQNGPNFYGHGFYTFGPEFFFRALSSEYGFKVDHFLIYEVSKPDKIYRISESCKSKEFWNISSKTPSSVLIMATRIGEGKDLIQSPPNQSGYHALWNPQHENNKVTNKKRRHSPLHGKRWYELWKWDRSRKRYAKQKMRKYNIGMTECFKPFKLDP